MRGAVRLLRALNAPLHGLGFHLTRAATSEALEKALTSERSGNYSLVVPMDQPYVLRPATGDYVYASLGKLFERELPAILANLERLRPWFDSKPVKAIPQEPAGDFTPHWGNPFFNDGDARVAYAMVAEWKPRRIIEIGSGNSTKFMRQAIRDGGLSCQLTSIDPEPRASIDQLCDRVVRRHLRDVDTALFGELEAGDILFLDGSHLVFNGSDTTHFCLEIMPLVRKGVFVHVHDLMLPYEYDAEFTRRQYNEQYMFAAILLNSAEWKTFLPVYYLVRAGKLVSKGGVSFWMRRE